MAKETPQDSDMNDMNEWIRALGEIAVPSWQKQIEQLKKNGFPGDIPLKDYPNAPDKKQGG